MLARRLSLLETYDFSIEHRPGKYHCNADSLSGRPADHCKQTDCPDFHFKTFGPGERPITKYSE